MSRVLFQRGQFSYSDTLFTARFLSFYALSIFPYALVVYATRVFYSMQDTRTPAWINIGGVGLNVALGIALLKPMGAPGIALASVLTYSLTAIVSFIVLKMRLGDLGGRKLAGALGRIVAATAVMALAVWFAIGRTDPAYGRGAAAPAPPCGCQSGPWWGTHCWSTTKRTMPRCVGNGARECRSPRTWISAGNRSSRSSARKASPRSRSK